jgi:hypothetical protein
MSPQNSEKEQKMTAMVTLKLVTQSGQKSLTPYKNLAEQALSSIFRQILD